MLKSYIYRSFTYHVFNQIAGSIVLAVFSFVALKHPDLIGIKDQYDFIRSSDILSFMSFFLILILMLVQFMKGYLLYTPSTYLSFNSLGISFKKFKKEYQFIKWEDVQIIELKVESEWLLTMFIKKHNADVIRVELSSLWLLSITKKWCVCHNFLKLITMANNNQVLMTKLVPDQVDELYVYCGVKSPTFNLSAVPRDKDR